MPIHPCISHLHTAVKNSSLVIDFISHSILTLISRLHRFYLFHLDLISFISHLHTAAKNSSFDIDPASRRWSTRCVKRQDATHNKIESESERVRAHEKENRDEEDARTQSHGVTREQETHGLSLSRAHRQGLRLWRWVASGLARSLNKVQLHAPRASPSFSRLRRFLTSGDFELPGPREEDEEGEGEACEVALMPCVTCSLAFLCRCCSHSFPSPSCENPIVTIYFTPLPILTRHNKTPHPTPRTKAAEGGVRVQHVHYRLHLCKVHGF